MIIYFGAIVSLLYYCGAMQYVLTRLAAFVQMTMGTTATESFNAVACIFLGQVGYQVAASAIRVCRAKRR